ncbi:helix-turn-helix domain-containing protein [Cupriavidus sp. CP313]
MLTDEERTKLTRLVRSKLTSVRLAQRARIVLLAPNGMQNKDIAEQLGIGRVQVSRWRTVHICLPLSSSPPGSSRGLFRRWAAAPAGPASTGTTACAR